MMQGVKRMIWHAMLATVLYMLAHELELLTYINAYVANTMGIKTMQHAAVL